MRGDRFRSDKEETKRNMLYKVFVDDSGKKEYINPYAKEFISDPPLFKDYPAFWQDNYFVLCGVRIKQEDLHLINPEINDLKKLYFDSRKVEIKSDWLRNPHQRKKHYLDVFNITPEKLNEFGEKFIDLIGKYKEQLKLIAVVFDKRCHGDAKRKTANGAPLLKTTQVLFERLQYAGGYNIVIFDQMESSLKLTIGQHDRILNVFQKNEGMEKIYVDKYDKVSDIKFMESCNENFLQIADICAYNINRQFMVFGREWSGMTKKTGGSYMMGGYSYFDRIRCNFLFHPQTRKVVGVGLCCLPDKEKVNWDILQGCFNNKKTPQK